MKPRRVVLDSNVFISAFLFGGPPQRVIEHALAGAVQVCLAFAILDEIRGVLQRPKFGLSAERTLAICDEIEALCTMVTPTTRVRAVPEDPDDNRVLECALAAKADAIVSGDAHLLKLHAWRGIAILDPAAMVRVLDG